MPYVRLKRLDCLFREKFDAFAEELCSFGKLFDAQILFFDG